MDSQQTRALMLASLERWQLKSRAAEDNDEGAAGIAVSLRHIEVFALATIANELHEIRLQAQGADEHPSPADSATMPGRGEALPLPPEQDRVNTEATPEGGIRKANGPLPLIDPRRKDDPCRETRTQKGGTQTYRCTRRQGHVGDHVDAAGTRWGGDTDA